MTAAVQSPTSYSSAKDWHQIQSIWSLQRAGGPIIFVLITIAYVVQTELTQAVQRTYHKPYLLLYLAHSGYAFLLPIQLLILKFFEPSISITERLIQIRELIIFQFNYQSQSSHDSSESRSSVESQHSDLQPLLSPSHGVPKQQVPLWWLIKRCIQLTLFLTLPAMCWYASVPLADMTSITAVFNTNSCFVYVFSVWFLESEQFEFRRTIGVIGSLIGALMISWSERPSSTSSDLAKISHPSRHLQTVQADGQLRWLGISLALLGSVGYALYEVWYKKFIALSDSNLLDGSASELYLSTKATSILPALEDIILDHQTYHGVEVNVPVFNQECSPLASVGVEEGLVKQNLEDSCRLMNKKKTSSKGTKAGLIYSNFMTTMVGLVTMSLLWIPIPILNHIGLEKFEMVGDWHTAGMILGIVIMGVTFNAGFMILLGLWGPVISSVGNLCALVLIAIVDKTIMSPNENDKGGFLKFDLFSFFGSILILTGFFTVTFFEKKK